MITAGAIHHTAGFTWGYNSTIYFDQHLGAEKSGTIRIYLMLIVIFCGVSGSLIGGTLTDFLEKRQRFSGIRAALVILISGAIFAAPFYVFALYLSDPYCYILLSIGFTATGQIKKIGPFPADDLI